METMKSWALCHLRSGHIQYFDSEEAAEIERYCDYLDWDQDDHEITYEEYCEHWIISKCPDD